MFENVLGFFCGYSDETYVVVVVFVEVISTCFKWFRGSNVVVYYGFVWLDRGFIVVLGSELESIQIEKHLVSFKFQG